MIKAVDHTALCLDACCAVIGVQGSRPELLPERLLGSVRFCHLDLKSAIPLNPADYHDDLLKDVPLSPLSVPHSANLLAPAPGGLTPEAVMQSSQSAQSLHSLRSTSVTGSNISAQDVGHLEALRQSSGSNGQQSAADRAKFASGPTSSPHLGSGPMWSGHSGTGSGPHMGSGQLSNAGSGGSSNERPWPGQQTHAGAPHQSAGLSTVPETQQPPVTVSQQAFRQSESMQPQHTSDARATGAGNPRGAQAAAERVRWAEKAVLSGHF